MTKCDKCGEECTRIAYFCKCGWSQIGNNANIKDNINSICHIFNKESIKNAAEKESLRQKIQALERKLEQRKKRKI